MKIVFLRDAEHDAESAARHYNRQRAGLGDEFLHEVEAALCRLMPDPLSWEPVEEDVRRCPTRRFPYDILFQARIDQILIVAVMHQHRDPGYWKSRLPDDIR